MAEIPYFFETPVPKYFRETGWFENPNTILFVTWAFAKCSPEARRVVHDGKEIELAPFEFITGRGTTCEASHLTENALRHQLNIMQKAGLLKKTTNSVTNRYTCYIWVTDRFSKPNNQLNNQQTTNSPPTEQPQSGYQKKETRSKKDHPPTPSFEEGGNDDDSFSKEKKKKAETPKVEVYNGVSMTQKDLDACIAIKGTIEEVRRAIEYITNHPGRKSTIASWPNAMKKWNIPNHVKDYMQENEEMGKRLDRDFSNAVGWRCYIYNDRNKDQRGLLFESTASTGNSIPVFIPFHDKDFQEKASKVIREKKMQKSRETKT